MNSSDDGPIITSIHLNDYAFSKYFEKRYFLLLYDMSESEFFKNILESKYLVVHLKHIQKWRNETNFCKSYAITKLPPRHFPTHFQLWARTSLTSDKGTLQGSSNNTNRQKKRITKANQNKKNTRVVLILSCWTAHRRKQAPGDIWVSLPSWSSDQTRFPHRAEVGACAAAPLILRYSACISYAQKIKKKKHASHEFA